MIEYRGNRWEIEIGNREGNQIGRDGNRVIMNVYIRNRSYSKNR